MSRMSSLLSSSNDSSWGDQYWHFLLQYWWIVSVVCWTQLTWYISECHWIEHHNLQVLLKFVKFNQLTISAFQTSKVGLLSSIKKLAWDVFLSNTSKRWFWKLKSPPLEFISSMVPALSPLPIAFFEPIRPVVSDPIATIPLFHFWGASLLYWQLDWILASDTIWNLVTVKEMLSMVGVVHQQISGTNWAKALAENQPLNW